MGAGAAAERDHTKAIETLNDLILINNDRIAGYKKAIAETKPEHSELKALFSNMASESRQYVEQLKRQIQTLGGTPVDGTTAAGKIYRVWMDVRNTFSRDDRKTQLELCEYGEDAAQRAYDDALNANLHNGEVYQLISDQKAKLKHSHDLIKAERNRISEY